MVITPWHGGVSHQRGLGRPLPQPLPAFRGEGGARDKRRIRHLVYSVHHLLVSSSQGDAPAEPPTQEWLSRSFALPTTRQFRLDEPLERFRLWRSSDRSLQAGTSKRCRCRNFGRCVSVRSRTRCKLPVSALTLFRQHFATLFRSTSI